MGAGADGVNRTGIERNPASTGNNAIENRCKKVRLTKEIFRLYDAHSSISQLFVHLNTDVRWLILRWKHIQTGGFTVRTGVVSEFARDFG